MILRLESQGLTKLTFELKTKTGLPKPKSLGVLRRSKFKTARVELVSSVQPKLLNYKIVNIHPHDTLSFTEGLEFYKDTL
jgi:glutamine cyclotransferase